MCKCVESSQRREKRTNIYFYSSSEGMKDREQNKMAHLNELDVFRSLEADLGIVIESNCAVLRAGEEGGRGRRKGGKGGKGGGRREKKKEKKKEREKKKSGKERERETREYEVTKQQQFRV